MKNLHNFIYHCSDCNHKFHISSLRTDCFDPNKLLCFECNIMRSCEVCRKELTLSWFRKDDHDYILCKDCYNYDIESCWRCNKMYYNKNLTYCKKDEMLLCEKCYYYNFVLYEYEKLDKLQQQN